MLTTVPTKQIVCAELDTKLRIKQEIFYDPQTKDEDKPVKQDKMGRYICPSCQKGIARIDNFRNHLKICKLKIVIEELKSDLKDKRYFKEYEVLPGNRLELLFHFNPSQQLRMYISGQAGVGKSYLIAQLLQEYVRRYENRRIFVFSMIPQDKDIDAVVEEHGLIESELFMRVDLKLFSQINSKNKIDTNIQIPVIDSFKNSLCIFDDIDKIPKTMGNTLKNIDALKDQILATGRDHNYQGDDIDIIVSNHQVLGGVRTSEILQQANYVVFFPQGLSSHGIKTACLKYLSMEPEHVNRILKVNGPHQYVIVHRDVPSFVLEQKKIWLIK